MQEMNENKAAKPQKIKKSYAFWPEVAEMIETHKYVHRGREIDFVSQAIRNYCAEIDGEKSLDVLCNRMYKIISAEADCHSNRMATMLFKIAVELSIQNSLLGAGYVALSDEEMRIIRNDALDKVRRSHGWFSIENAMEEEKKYSGK